MVGCSAFGCSNSKRNSSDKSFHSFPFKDAALLEQWKVAVRRQHVDGQLWVPGKNCRLCSDHFKDSDFQVRPGTERRLLKQGAIPSVFKAHPQHLQIRCAVRRSPRKRSHCDTGGNNASSPHMSDEHIESLANSSSQMSDEPSGSASLSRPGSAVDHIYSKPSSHLKVIQNPSNSELHVRKRQTLIPENKNCFQLLQLHLTIVIMNLMVMSRQ